MQTRIFEIITTDTIVNLYVGYWQRKSQK